MKALHLNWEIANDFEDTINDISIVFLDSVAEQLTKDFDAHSEGYFNSKDLYIIGLIVSTPALDDIIAVFVDENEGNAIIRECYYDEREENLVLYENTIATISVADPRSVEKTKNAIIAYFEEKFAKYWRKINIEYPPDSQFMKYIIKVISSTDRKN